MMSMTAVLLVDGALGDPSAKSILDTLYPAEPLRSLGWERVSSRVSIIEAGSANSPATVETDVGFGAVCCEFQINGRVVRR